MKLKLNEDIRLYIDSNRGEHCRAKYILMCVNYIRDNNIDIDEYYEGINNDRVTKSLSRRED